MRVPTEKKMGFHAFMNSVVYESFLDELSSIQKEAGARDALKAIARTRRLVKKVGRVAKKVPKVITKIPEHIDDAALKAYVKSPDWAQKTHNKAMQLFADDPEGVAGYARPAIQAAKKLLGG